MQYYLIICSIVAIGSTCHLYKEFLELCTLEPGKEVSFTFSIPNVLSTLVFSFLLTPVILYIILQPKLFYTCYHHFRQTVYEVLYTRYNDTTSTHNNN